MTSYSCRMEISAYVRRVLQVSMGAQQIGAYLASGTRLYGSQGPLTLIARAVENTSILLSKGGGVLTRVRLMSFAPLENTSLV